MFQEARALLNDGAIPQACDAFAKSYGLRPRHGTLLNLAVCLEQQGDAVAAFSRFEEALSAAVGDGRADRAQLARTHIEGLRARLAWLSVQLDVEADLPELQIFCDGVALAKDVRGAFPVEPGSHTVKAIAPGRTPFEVTVTTVAGGTEVVPIPVLTLIVPPAPKPTTSFEAPIVSSRPPVPQRYVTAPSGDPSQQWRDPLSLSLLAAGTAALSLGAFCGVRAIIDGNAVERLCVDRRCTSDVSLSTAQHLEDRARVEARVANIALPSGAIALGASAYLLWTKPRQSRATMGTVGHLQFVPTASRDAVGTTLRGTW